ncbi:MAG: FtsQ-type POTRA domain-containing protein [Clostridia bacterium]|nr:FtsQ-type POTRA domain-containing protein [Clostridia bacterium]
MKNKVLFTIIIATLFVLISVFTIFSVFIVKHVEVEYSVLKTGAVSADGIQNKLSQIKGDNLIFVDTDSVVNSLKEYTYFEVVSCEKSYPNTLKVTLNERIARFSVSKGGKKFVISSNGFVLEENADKANSLITLTTATKPSGSIFKISNATVGANLAVSHQEIANICYEIINTASLADYVTQVSVYYTGVPGANMLFLHTYTSAVIVIQDFTVKPIAKAKVAASSYASRDDYHKANYFLYTFEDATSGEIKVDWSKEQKFGI